VALNGNWLRVREQIHSNYLGQHLADAAPKLTRFSSSSAQLCDHGLGTAPAAQWKRSRRLVQREANVARLYRRVSGSFWLAS